MRIILLLTMLGCLTSAHAEEYFRSIDQVGKIHYGDAPLPNATEVEKLKAKSKPIPDNTLPFETKRATEKAPVTLYSAEGCGEGCMQARDLLSSRGIPYTEQVLVTVDEIADFKKRSGSDSMPTISIGNLWLQGFLAQQWHDELDKAGYPKNAPFGLRPQDHAAKMQNNK